MKPKTIEDSADQRFDVLYVVTITNPYNSGTGNLFSKGKILINKC